ncbi:hypothetical protein D7Z54_33285 [Salibacterium salarium]|uniref:Uncharacterized protein n=1 Tax=Salibacterium salarium TaxID=284579 RepID=A0A428MSD7_9BACI|nr:hypothetical protein D7Z54_33285 [Salibacterium salarium]
MSYETQPLVQRILERGQPDTYPLADYTLPDLLRSIPVDMAITAGAFAILFLNRYTRPYTIAGVALYGVAVLA